MKNIHPTAFIADGAKIVGDVEIGADCGIWYNAVIRGDSDTIKIGERTNIQDLCVLHVDRDFRLSIGSGVTVGHGAIVHGCTVGDNVLIGMGAIILNGAVIGDECIIGAGALVTEHMEIPSGSVVIGSPAKVKRALTEKDRNYIYENAKIYVRHAKEAKERELR